MYSLQAARICPARDAKTNLPVEVLFQVFGQLVTFMKQTDLIQGFRFPRQSSEPHSSPVGGANVP